MTISHIMEILSPDDIMTATFEFTLKNHSKTHRTLMCLPLLPYMVTPITKQTSPLNSHQKTTQNIYNTYVFATIAIYGHSDHKMNITIEFTSKNHSEHIEHLWVCRYCHIWSL